jgi:type I restriction enzyme R subunit
MLRSNFEFLKGVNDLLYRIALASEKNYPDDPHTTLVKLRLFGEWVGKDIAIHMGVELPDSQHELIRKLSRFNWTNHIIIGLFHKLRKVGNLAVHEYHDDLPDAQMTLQLAFRLAVWYYRLKSNNIDFEAPRFVLPDNQPLPQFQQQIDQLNTLLSQANHLNTQTDSELRAKTNQITALNSHLDILQNQTEQHKNKSEAHIQALEVELEKTRQQLLQLDEGQRKQAIARFTTAATSRTLELSEPQTRFIIDQQLRDAGWIADTQVINHARGVRPQVGKNLAIAEWPTSKDETGHTGYADYVLFVGNRPVGVIEAKKQNLDVSGKLNEAERYSLYFDNEDLAYELAIVAANDETITQPNKIAEPLAIYAPQWPQGDSGRFFKIPFVYSANGREYSRQLLTKSGIWHRDVRKTTNQAKALPVWHTPAELMAKLAAGTEAAHRWLQQNLPDDLGLRYFQQEAVTAAEQAIIAGQHNVLLAMATGTGKTRTAIALMYRLIQSRCFSRVLFLVDRRSLGKQALDAFDDTRIQDVPFNTIFSIKGLTDKFPSDSTKVHVATIQSLVNRTLQSDEFMPTGRYDCLIVDEAHRGYTLDKDQSEGEMAFRNQLEYISAYRRILDHFDAVKIGLTATPAPHTTDIFGQPTYRYSYRKAVIDGYLTDQEPPIRIITKRAEQGVKLSAGTEVLRLTRQGELVADTTDDEQDFEVADYNRSLIVSGFNKVVADVLADDLDPKGQQKTLIFCVNNTHADMMVAALHTAFGAKDSTFEPASVIKITGDSDKDANKVQSLIDRFKQDRLPNIVITVDLLTTGIDIPKICNLVFLRKVKSRILYEQMKGRATRLCDEIGKTSFKIYDAVDLYRTLQSVDTMRPVVVNPKVPLSALVNEITDSQTYKTTQADGRSFAEHSHDQLVSKIQRIIGQARYNRDKSPQIDQSIKRMDDTLASTAGCDFDSFATTLKGKGPRQSAEIFTQSPKLVERLEQLKQLINIHRNLPIFVDIEDELIAKKQGFGDYDNPEDFLDAFDKLVAVSENQQMALHTVITKPKDLTRKALIELQEWFDNHSFDESALRVAWKAKTNQDVAARLIGHIRRAAVGDALLPFDTRVENALDKIKQQNDWTAAQLSWLDRLANSLKEQVAIDDDTFKTGNYKRNGGKNTLQNVFDGELDTILAQLNDYMWEQPA